MWWTHLFTASSRNSRLLALSLVATVAISAIIIPSEPRVQAAGQVIDVPAGGNLQQALNAVQPGGTIRLAAGATYVGSFTLPAKGGAAYILITTNTVLPPAGRASTPAISPGSRQFDPTRRSRRSRQRRERATTELSASRSRRTRMARATSSPLAGRIRRR